MPEMAPSTAGTCTPSTNSDLTRLRQPSFADTVTTRT